MGQRGPLPDPKPRRVQPTPPATAPPPPDDLTPAVAATWTAFWSSPVAGLVEDVDLPVVHRLFRLYVLHERTSTVVNAALITKGSMGQIRINPAAEYVLRLETAILRLENELGVTPAARARLGIDTQADVEDVPAEPSVVLRLARRREAAG